MEVWTGVLVARKGANEEDFRNEKTDDCQLPVRGGTWRGRLEGLQPISGCQQRPPRTSFLLNVFSKGLIFTLH